MAVFSYFNASARQGDQTQAGPAPATSTAAANGGRSTTKKPVWWLVAGAGLVAGGGGCGAAATSSLTHAQLRGSATAPRPPKIRGPPALVLAGERGLGGKSSSSLLQPGRAAS